MTTPMDRIRSRRGSIQSNEEMIQQSLTTPVMEEVSIPEPKITALPNGIISIPPEMEDGSAEGLFQTLKDMASGEGVANTGALQGPLQGDESKGGSMSSPGVGSEGSKKKVTFKKKKKEISKRDDTIPEEGQHKYGSVTYADPTNKKYPIDTAAHVRAAWSYINMPKNAEKYSSGEVAAIKGRIKKAATKLGVSISTSNKAYGSPKSKSIRIEKGTDGLRLAYLVTSNSYKDREDETVTTKALKEYVENSWSRVEGQCNTNNDFLFWHGGDRIGSIIWCDMEGPFLIEVAKEAKNRKINIAREGDPAVWTTVKEVWDYVENNPNVMDAISQGFHFFKNKAFLKTKTYDRVFKFESSILPHAYASNSLTLAEVTDMSKRDEILAEITGKPESAQKARRLRGSVGNLATLMDALGIQHKEKKVAKTDDPENDPEDDDQEETSEKGIMEDMQKEIGDFLGEISDDPEAVSEMTPRIMEIVAGYFSSENGGGGDFTSGRKNSGYSYNNPNPSLRPMTKELELMSTLVDTQESISERMDTIEGLVTSIKGVEKVPDVLTTLANRLGRIEKQLSVRPKTASESDETVYDDADLFERVKEQLAKHDSFWGAHVESEQV